MVRTRSNSRAAAINSSLEEDGKKQDFLAGYQSDLEKMRQTLKEERKKIKWLQRPDKVVYHFMLYLVKFIVHYSRCIFNHFFTRYIAIPTTLIWYILRQQEGVHLEYIQETELTVSWMVWWIGLGILSSVGLGSGMHSGLLFLFPHIFKVVLASEQCGLTIFNGLDPRKDIWFNVSPFQCEYNFTPAGDFVPFKQVFLSCYLSSVLWGAGTAIGEIPPYVISRAAALTNAKDEEFEEMTANSGITIIDNMKDWMISFLQRHGFWGVFLMSAWPNMAFDLCGICCGHFLMPFSTFFGATLLGKAGVKVAGQVAFFIFLFTERRVSQLITFVEYYTKDHRIFNVDLAKELNDFLVQQREKFHSGNNNPNSTAENNSNVFVLVFKSIIPLFIGLFVLSCIEQFAQQHAAEQDKKMLVKIKTSKKKKN